MAPQANIIRITGTHIAMMNERYMDVVVADMRGRVTEIASKHIASRLHFLINGLLRGRQRVSRTLIRS